MIFQDADTKLTAADISKLKSDLDTIMDEILQVDPDLECYAAAAVLVAAALLGSPDINSLVQVTGYSRGFIEPISRLMHASGLWSDGHVECDHWLVDGNWSKHNVVLDVLVAEGHVIGWGRPDGLWMYHQSLTGRVVN
jgi:hypothetical protein